MLLMLSKFFSSFIFMRFICQNEKGQSIVEYGLIIALTTVVVIPIVILVGDSVDAMYKYISNKILGVLHP